MVRTDHILFIAAGAFHAGDTAHAELCLEQALSLSANDRQIRERTLAALGGLARARNDFAAAARYGEELLDSADHAPLRWEMGAQAAQLEQRRNLSAAQHADPARRARRRRAG